ncbi:hypothetical protein SPRG_18303 [Saprolegnia parasitica CBS 223.65]|uniref:Uncharacterized protein n=1 Tax=Saprolegnia parasitica (strain CBS 223.65) TaxID=695850 RepID=A0A067BDJ6_SAPPC|nr:hypothetical protein SPRG_18303 [Saprolegnia parasitica CBS 223.65]KDO16163.1 hypothetical protein SPRG_18303 [Saprolegnia parasitica CBS 223.65]|eukprot:XP_012213130.1 hypothetical protein SPRG_18303 [Saprolegnia parasitica CBS 223.65]
MDVPADDVLATEPVAAPSAMTLDFHLSDTPTRVSRPSRLNTQMLGQLQTRQYLLTLGFFISCVWNLVAPLKAWALSRYGFVSTADTVVLNVNWNTVLNGRFLTKLYTSSGIALDAPRAADRYINVFLDFIVVPRSELTWAKSLYNTADVFQMDLGGRCMRHSLDGPRQVDQFNKDISAYEASGYPLWGTEVIRTMVPPVPGFVQLHEISEAMLCLKGMPLEDYVNVQFVSSLLPYNKSSDAAAIAMWRQKLFPHLSECLARRQQLLAAADPPADGVAALAKELATTFNTGLVNIAGHAQLYTPMTFLDGFVDLSGLKSGSVTYQLNGRDPSALLFAGSGYLDAMMTPRETAWWCSIQYVDPATSRPNATQCFEKVATTLPSVFLGKYVVAGAGSRYVDSADFTQGGARGALTPYAYKSRKQAALADVEYVSRGNLSAWNGLFKQLVATVNNAPIVVSDALEELCLVGDGCFNVCMNETASGGTTLTYMRSGVCVSAVDKVAHGLLDSSK